MVSILKQDINWLNLNIPQMHGIIYLCCMFGKTLLVRINLNGRFIMLKETTQAMSFMYKRPVYGLTLMECQFVCPLDSTTFERQRQETWLVHFLMTLCPICVNVRGLLLHKSPLSSVSIAHLGLLAEEQTQKSLLKKKIVEPKHVFSAHTSSDP